MVVQKEYENDKELEDFFDPGMHVTWLVKDAYAFPLKPGPTSDRDRSLHFGLTHQEWLALYFDVLGAKNSNYEKLKRENPHLASEVMIDEFDGEILEYPMLSRIQGRLYDAVFEAEEAKQLRQECIRVQVNTSNAIALRGLDKLLRICAWAQELNLSIYLMCD